MKLKSIALALLVTSFAAKTEASEIDKFTFPVSNFFYFTNDAGYKLNGIPSLPGQPLLVVYSNADSVRDHVFYVRDDPKTALSIVMTAQATGKNLMCGYYSKEASPGPMRFRVSCNALGISP